MESATFADNDYCFACGSLNPSGLRLQFEHDGPRLLTRLTPRAEWQGFAGVLHGGLQATVLDDLMSNHLLRVEGVWVATAELTLRFRAPVPVDRELLFTSEVVSRSGRLWSMRATCTLATGGRALTTASGGFMEVPRPAT